MQTMNIIVNLWGKEFTEFSKFLYFDLVECFENICIILLTKNALTHPLPTWKNLSELKEFIF